MSLPRASLSAILLFFIQAFIMLTHYFSIIYTNFKWVFDFLLYHPFYKLSQAPTISENLNISHFEPNSDEEVECSVCLCKILEGEEIRVLRCGHLYHRDCLDRWVGFENETCPLCRDFLGPRRPIAELGAEILLFRFCSFSSGRDHRERWWLR